MGREYLDAYHNLESAIKNLEGYEAFKEIRDDLIVLKDKMADEIW